MSSEKPFITAGVSVKRNAELTMPCTRHQPVIRSRLPSSRFRLPSIDSPTLRADARASSSDTLSPTAPNGPASEPSGSCGPWPEM